MKIEIRRATSKDLDFLHEMWKLLIKHESKIDPLINKNKSYFSKAKQEYKKSLKKNSKIFLIAEINKIPVGYIYGWIEKTPNTYKPRLRGYVCDAFIKKKFRGKGVGTKLTNEILKVFKSKKVSWIKLTVYSKNTNSVKIWRKLGFKDRMIEMEKML